MKVHYDPKLKERAKELRNNSTMSEVLLWKRLRGRNLKGYKFVRQKPIDCYIVDFYCYELRLVVEIDGPTHDNKQKYDLERQKRIESLGFTVLRYLDSDVKNNIEGVVADMEIWIERRMIRRE